MRHQRCCTIDYGDVFCVLACVLLECSGSSVFVMCFDICEYGCVFRFRVPQYCTIPNTNIMYVACIHTREFCPSDSKQQHATIPYYRVDKNGTWTKMELGRPSFFSPKKKIPHHDENACYYDPRRGNKNADAPMILQWIALSTMLYRLLCSESATLSRLASNHMLCRRMWFFTISGTHHRRRCVYSVDNVNWSKIFVARIDIMREVGAMAVAARLTR